MKKLIGILTALTLLFLLVGCSNKSTSKYDEEINKVLEYKKLDRKEVNIQVYDNVSIDTDKVKGTFNVYSFEYWNINYPILPSHDTKKTLYSYENAEIRQVNDFYIISKDDKILKVPYKVEQQIKNSYKVSYNENKIKNDDVLKKDLELKLQREIEEFKKTNNS